MGFGSRTAGNHEEFVMASLHAGILITRHFEHVASVLPSHVTAVFNMQVLDFIRWRSSLEICLKCSNIKQIQIDKVLKVNLLYL